MSRKRLAHQKDGNTCAEEVGTRTGSPTEEARHDPDGASSVRSTALPPRSPSSCSLGRGVDIKGSGKTLPPGAGEERTYTPRSLQLKCPANALLLRRARRRGRS